MHVSKRIRPIFSFVLAMSLLLNLFMGMDLSISRAEASTTSATDTILTGLTSNQIVELMGRGWNLGNTFDSTGGSSVADFETNWGNPKVTKTLIKGVHDAGFNTIRIPVTWYRAMSSDGTYTIDSAYLERVKTIIDYAYEYDMFVILNVHHENWINNANLVTNYKSIGTELNAVWTQLAAYFANYDQHLIFEGMNEPRLADTSYEWTGYQEAYEVINYLDQVFVSTVRADGTGYNNERCLMIPGYAASSSTAVLSSITLPTYNGEVADNLIISVHCYAPNAFCLNDTWSTFDETDSTYTSEIDTIFSDINEQFLSQGIAVVIGESSATNTSNNTSARAAWAKYMGKKSASYGVPIVFWDNGVDGTSGGECHSYINRTTGASVYPSILTAFDEGYNSVTYGSAVTTGSSSQTSLIGGSVIWQNTSGTSIAKSWNTSYVSIGAQSSYYTSGRSIAVVYSGTAPKLVFDSSSLEVWWACLDSPSSTATVNGKKVAYFTYEAILSTLTSNNITSPSYLRNMYVISGSTDTVVYEVSATGQGAIVSYMVLGANYYNGTDLPADPTYDGYTFLGWYTTKNYQAGTELDINSITEDTTAYAKFKLNDDVVSTPKVTATATPTTKVTATATPTTKVTSAPTEAPTATVTAAPTEAPTATVTAAPTEAPTATVTAAPTEAPTATVTSAPTEAPTAAALTAPKLVSATNVAAGVTVKWSKVTGASGYYIYRKAGSASKWTKIATVTSGSVIAYTDKNVSSGTNYKYTVRAYNGTKLSSYVAAGIATKHLSVPKLSKAANTTDGLKVTWNKVNGASGYYVYRRVKGGAWQKLATVSGNSKVNYTDTTAVSGTTYIYTVRAYNSKYISSYVSAGVKCLRLKNPTVKLSSTTGKGKVSWNSISGAAGYYIYRKAYGTSTWTKIAAASGSATSYIDKTAVSGKKYYYTVRAYKGSYMSAYNTNLLIKIK